MSDEMRLRRCGSCHKKFVGRDYVCPECREMLDEAFELLPRLENSLDELRELLRRDKSGEN